MRLGIVLLWCLFLLCITRTAQRPLAALSLRDSSWAALSLLLLCANAFVFRPVTEFGLNPAALILCIATGTAASRNCKGMRVMQAIACAVPASLCMLALSRLQTAGAIALPEPGLFLALAGLLFLLPLRDAPAAALFGMSVAPILLGFWNAGLDLYSFGYTVMDIGLDLAFDAQVAGLFLAGILFSLLAYRKRPAEHMPQNSRATP